MSGEKDIFLKGQVARDFDFYRIREKVASLAVSEEGKFFLLSRESSRTSCGTSSSRSRTR